MKIKYKFYLVGREDHYMEYNPKELDKEIIYDEVVNIIFPEHKYCIKEKWVDGILNYTNTFQLDLRRVNF